MDLKKTLSEQIYEILRNDIVTQAIPCGSKLTLKILQERFHVSSTPIREALTRLAEEQLASYYSNIGVSVVSLDETDVKGIYQFMGDLDSLAVSYASRCPDQKPILSELRENLSRMDACDLASPSWQDYSDRFHLIFYDYCENSRLVHSAQRMRSQMSILAYQYEKQAPKQDLILKEHHMIFSLYETGQYEGAVAMMKEHLSHSLEFAMEIARKQPRRV